MPKNDDNAILLELRERYRYASDKWRKARENRAIDLRYVQGDPWEEDDKKARDDAGRPCINHDELNQYLNHAVNNVRQNKRGIKVEPEGNGATEKTASFQQGMVRAIEKHSTAPQIYCQAFQSMIEGGYGFFRVSREYIGATFNQRVVIKGIANSDSVLVDPDAKAPDWSDQKYSFVVDGNWTEDEFKRRWPHAEVTSFGPEEMRVATDWVSANKNILVCEYWSVEEQEQLIHLLPSGEIVTELRASQKPVKSRSFPKKTLIQRFTNGVEILEETEQPGEQIPIIPMFGLERWVDRGSGPEREINSMIRLARDPQMSLAYLVSQQMEEAGLTPKTPYIGYTGQFESDADAWLTVTKTPHAYLQADPIVDTATGQVLPLPQRQQFTPNFQSYEVAKDSARRAIQAAMGISPLPTAMQRSNEKSGAALEKINAAQDLGSFHFVDAFDRALTYAGRVILDWIKVTYDTEQEFALHQPDGGHKVVRINTPEPTADPETGELSQYDVQEGDHYPDVSTGPSYQSQREEAADFLNSLITNLKGLPLPPPQLAKLLSLAIQMRDLGPLGDEMAEVVDPEGQQNTAAQAQQQLAQLKEHAQALFAHTQQLQAEVQQLQFEKAARVVDNQAKLALEKMKLEAGVTEAEITTKSQQLSERLKFVQDLWQQLHSQAHDVGMQAQQQQAAALQQAQQQQHEQGLQQQAAAQQQQQQQQEPQDEAA